jgi:hypothetical protein
MTRKGECPLRLFRLALPLVLLICAVSAAAAADGSWKPMRDRRDFKVEDAAAALDSAIAELKGVYGAELDEAALRKAESHVHTISVKNFNGSINAEIIDVMIQDLSVGEPDCYYEVVFDNSDMSVLDVGGVWLDISPEDYLNALPARLYDEPGEISGDAEPEDDE